MKKFYTLLSAALLATGLLSAAQLKTVDSPAKVALASEAKATLKVNGKSGLQMKSVAPRIKDPNAKEINLAGDWIFGAIDEEDNNEVFYGATTIVAGENSGEYTIKNFLGGYFTATPNDIKATVAKQTIGGKTYDILTFELTPIAANLGGYDYSLYLYAFDEEDNRYYFYSQSQISFIVYEQEDGSILLMSAYNNYDSADNFKPAGVFYGNKRGNDWYGAAVLMPYIYPTNATLTAEVYDFQNQTFVDGGSARMFTGISSQTNEMLFLNFAGSSNEITAKLSTDMASLTMTDQVFIDYPISDTDNTPKPYVLTSVSESGEASETNTVNGTVTVNGKDVVITFPGEVGAYNKEGDIYMGIWKDIKITLDNEDNAGLNNVIADSDVNAPVEYYNLQGMRVANPEAGQLVIKRQGKTVSKIVVR